MWERECASKLRKLKGVGISARAARESYGGVWWSYRHEGVSRSHGEGGAPIHQRPSTLAFPPLSFFSTVRAPSFRVTSALFHPSTAPALPAAAAGTREFSTIAEITPTALFLSLFCPSTFSLIPQFIQIPVQTTPWILTWFKHSATHSKLSWTKKRTSKHDSSTFWPKRIHPPARSTWLPFPSKATDCTFQIHYDEGSSLPVNPCVHLYTWTILPSPTM